MVAMEVARSLGHGHTMVGRAGVAMCAGPQMTVAAAGPGTPGGPGNRR